MGPLELSDYVGLDTMKFVMDGKLLTAPDGLEKKRGKLGAYAMKRVGAGVHLRTLWLCEPAKRPNDWVDICLDCSFLRQCKHQVHVFTVEWTWARPGCEHGEGSPQRTGQPSSADSFLYQLAQRVSNPWPLAPDSYALPLHHSGRLIDLLKSAEICWKDRARSHPPCVIMSLFTCFISHSMRKISGGFLMLRHALFSN